MLDTVTIRETDEKRLTLVEVTPKDLGLTGHRITGKEILAAAKKKGLKRCPAWVGPQYRLDCDDDEHTLIGTEPVHDSDNDPNVFSVGRDDSDGPWLGVSDVRYGWGLNPEVDICRPRVVFVSHISQQSGDAIKAVYFPYYLPNFSAQVFHRKLTVAHRRYT